MKIKNFLLICLLVLLVSCTSCKNNDKKIVVGASPFPHASILNECKEYVKSKGYELEVITYTDYITPNLALASGDIDANFFQHEPYLKNFNEKNNTDLVSVYRVHYEPLGLYAGKSHDLSNIKDGAVISIPNDHTNRARALFLLQTLGLITLDPEKQNLDVTKADIIDNPHHIDILEVEAMTITTLLKDVDFAVINGNYVETFKVDPSLRIAQEDADSIAAKEYGNVIAVKKGNENLDKIKVLIEALSQESVKEFIRNTYKGTVIPY